MTFEELIDKLLDNGIEITLIKKEGVVWYDLNTQMKSDLLVAKPLDSEHGEIAITQGRYGHEGVIYDWSCLVKEVRGCLHGRDFMNGAWQELLMKEEAL